MTSECLPHQVRHHAKHGSKAQIKYHDLAEEGGKGSLTEWVQLTQLRPLPPPPPPPREGHASWLDEYSAEDEFANTLELRHGDGWWTVTLRSKEVLKGTTYYHVRYLGGGQDHRVLETALRPFWTWCHRFPGGWLRGAPALDSEEAKAAQVIPLQPGQPPYAASLFEIGYARIGLTNHNGLLMASECLLMAS
jgi:hypothetical protein